MIQSEELQELLQFRNPQPDAISLYFQPPKPTELAHREEPILLKESIQQSIGDLRGSSPAMRADLDRLLEMAANFKSGPNHGKVIFACSRQSLWREYDLPGDFGVHFEIGNSLALAPLVAGQVRSTRYCIALADRNRARLLLLESNQITEQSQLIDEEKEKIRTTGARFSNHAERHKEQPAREHFQFLADHLFHFHEHDDYDQLLIGCRDEMWPEIERTFNSELKRILIGHFRVDPGLASKEEVQERAEPLIAEHESREEERMVEVVEGEAQRNGLGAVGLASVVDAIAKGEVQTLLWSAEQNSPPRVASLCSVCSSIQLGEAKRCEVCGGETWLYPRAEEALIRHPQARGVRVRRLRTAKLPPPDYIGALLRFRAERSTGQALAS